MSNTYGIGTPWNEHYIPSVLGSWHAFCSKSDFSQKPSDQNHVIMMLWRKIVPASASKSLRAKPSHGPLKNSEISINLKRLTCALERGADLNLLFY